MTTILYDIETDGLLDAVTTAHCIVTVDVETEEYRCFHDSPSITPRHGSIEEGVAYLGQADRTAGHNILEYDASVLRKLGFVSAGHRTQDRTRMLDTAVLSRLVYSDRKERDYALLVDERISPKNIGQHSLRAWGDRLGFPKAEYDGGWAEFSQEMLDYCIRDVEVNLRLLKVLMKRAPVFEGAGLTTVQMEHLFAGQLFDQQQRGARLDRKFGETFVRQLRDRREVLEAQIQEEFPPLKDYYKKTKTGKRRRIKDKETGEYRDHKLIPFNPGSRQQLAARLTKKHGWVPKELTDKGNPVMQERILLDLAEVYPEVGLIAEWLILNSRIAILEDGPSGYFRLCDKDDVLHGRTLHIGTVTHRCSHTKPNTGNVTSVRKPYGRELRRMFIPHKGGYRQVGFDADGLELRMLAHYLAEFDGGSYGEAVTSGSKELGTDAHTLHAKAISRAIDCDRDTGKTCTYAFLYGAGDTRLGKTFGAGSKLGKRIRSALRENIYGLDPLLDRISKAVKREGSLVSLDGRRVGIRHEHAALNSLLQTAGAVVMKWVPVLLGRRLEEAGIEYLQTGHIHDEIQCSLREKDFPAFQEAVRLSFEEATEALGLRVPVTGTADIGDSWADTH